MTPDIRPVLVLGAGINGAAIARHLVLAGVSVCVVDQADIAGGTTAYSSRLIHGGLRYLEHGDLGLVHEALGDRDRLLRLAPHHVRPLQLFIPIAKRSGGWLQSISRFVAKRSKGKTTERGLWLVQTGLSVYDQIARHSKLPRHQTRTAGEPNIPAVDSSRFRWLCSYWDAQVMYPERYTLALLTDARQVAQSSRVDFQVYTYSRAHITGDTVNILNVNDSLKSASSASIQPSLIINATGCWVDATLARLDVESSRLIGGTKGSHLLVASRDLRRHLDEGGVYAEADDGRPFFVLPFGTQTLIGTTDIPWDSDPDAATASEAEISYLLAATQRVFPDITVNREDIVMHCAGVRPLPAGDAASPGAITRRHQFVHHKSGSLPIISIVGGKLTTSDSLASQATDLVLEQLGLTREPSADNRPIPGSIDYPDSHGETMAHCQTLSDEFEVPIERVRATWSLWGTQTTDVLKFANSGKEDRAGYLDSIIGTDVPRGAVRWAIRQEWATHLTDLLERRLMMLYHHPLSMATLRDLAGVLGEELQLSEQQVEQQVEQCIERCQNHFGKPIV